MTNPRPVGLTKAICLALPLCLGWIGDLYAVSSVTVRPNGTGSAAGQTTEITSPIPSVSDPLSGNFKLLLIDMVELKTIAGGGFFSVYSVDQQSGAVDINDAGDVVGSAYQAALPSGDLNDHRPFLWRGGTFQWLTDGPAQARAINNDGDILISTSRNTTDYGKYYVSSLSGNPPSRTLSLAYDAPHSDHPWWGYTFEAMVAVLPWRVAGITDDRRVFGLEAFDILGSDGLFGFSNYKTRSFIAENGAVEHIPTTTIIRGINARGQILYYDGKSPNFPGVDNYVPQGGGILSGGLKYPLPKQVEGLSLNKYGQVAGIFHDLHPVDGGELVPILWDNGEIQRLPHDMMSEAVAADINDYGNAVGEERAWTIYGWVHSAVLWRNGEEIYLADHVTNLENWTLESASGINNHGQIIGLGTKAGVWHAVLLTPAPSLAIDANRDGTLKFENQDASDATTEAHPFRFWLNDDIDEWVTYTAAGVVETETELDDKNITDVSKQNWRNNIIDNERDLEDFARIQLSLQGMSDAVKNGQLYLGLKWKSTTGTPAIKLYRATDADGSTGYLTTPTAASRQALEAAIVDARYPGYTPDGQFASDHTVIEGTDVFVIPSLQFINLSESNPRTNFLFEGCKAGTGQLAVVILKKETDGSFTTIGEGSGVWLDLKEPKEFIQRWTCGDGDLGTVTSVTLDTTKSGTFGAPSNDEEKDLVLYVHGYNMQEFEKQRWIETTYKRLWHLGYKGRVGGFTWPCSQSPSPFNASEQRAWQSGAQLRLLLDNNDPNKLGLKQLGYRVHLLGHSQGNVVIGEALRLAGPNAAVASTYIASQAAIPAHCYDASQPDRSGPIAFTPTTPNVYGRYWTTGQDAHLPESWPANSPSYLDSQNVQGAAGKFVNFFNPQDYALSGNGFSLLADDGSQPGWLADQRLKPVSGYGYNNTEGFFFGVDDPAHGVSRTHYAFPTDRFEVFTNEAQARSLALGASAGMGGVFTSEVNLTDAPFNFRNQHIYHSGQFRSSYAARWQYWQKLLDACQLFPRDHP